MNKVPKYIVVIIAYLAVLYPLYVRFQSLDWAFDSSLLFNLFPMFGILAFTLLWLHAMSGVFEPWLREQINFDRFVSITSKIILFSLILHPLLLFIAVDFSISNIYLYYEFKLVSLGIIGWLLLITYDIAKPFLNYEFVRKQWPNILTISTIGFLMTFFHSLNIGSDLQSGPLRIIWIFYGVTAILATIYTYGIKRFFLKK